MSIHDLGVTPSDMTDSEYRSYRRFVQCTEMYHCTPSQLDLENDKELEIQWYIRNKIAETENKKSDRKSGVRRINANTSSLSGL